jgi:uncharacterized protein YbjT (DUF2867 family)
MILVTGASGRIGRRVVQHLLSRNIPVRAFVRRENALADLKSPCLEVVTGTFEDQQSLEQAVKGVTRLFLVAKDNPEQVQQHANVIEAAERHGVLHIVKLSAFGASTDSPISLMRWHAETEKQLKHADVSWTLLRPHLYMDNLLRAGDAVAEKKQLAAPMGRDKFSLIDSRDISEVAAKVLYGKGHASKIYTLTGRHAVSYNQAAEHLSRILQHPVTYSEVSKKEFYEQLLAEGTPSWRAYDLAHIADAYPGDKKSFVTNDAESLLNRPVRSLQTFFTDYASEFQKK